MKLSFLRNKTVVTVTTILLLFTFGEFIADKIWGDGDGSLTNHNIHKYIFTVQIVIAYFLFYKLINWFYILFFRNKISSSSLLQKGGQIFFILLIIFSCFLILEITSRYFFPSEGAFDRLYPVENARKPFPYVMFKGVPNSPTGFGNEMYNDHGYRGPYPKMPEDTNEFRIVFMGGSAVWEGDPSIPKLLEQEFKKNNFNNIRVYNFGVVSSVSSMELAAIVNEVTNLSPDLVIMYNGANDITSPLKYDPRPGYPFNFLVYENNPFLKKNYPALTLFAYKSNLARLLVRKYFTEKFSRISKLKKNAAYNSEKWRNEIADIYIENQKKAKTICKAYHSECFTFLQPMVYFKKNLAKEEQEFSSAHKNDKEHCLILRDILIKKTNPMLNDSAGFYFKDLSQTYVSFSQQVFQDDVHTLQEAKPFIAKIIFNELLTKINFRK
jgi:lysophospholipase L1-like esterase